MKRIHTLMVAAAFGLLATSALTPKATAAPILVYNFTLSSKRTTYFYAEGLPLTYALQKPVATQIILRDVATQTSTEIDTLVSGKTKLYRVNFKTNADAAAKTWAKIETAGYGDRVRLYNFPTPTTIKTPGLHFEIIRRYDPDTSAFVSFGSGKLSNVKLVKANTTVQAPVSIAASSHYWGTEFVDPTFLNFYPGQRIQLTPETATFKLSQAYSEAVNVADATDTATPANLVPGTLPYAAYRMEVILRKAGYR